MSRGMQKSMHKCADRSMHKSVNIDGAKSLRSCKSRCIHRRLKLGIISIICIIALLVGVASDVISPLREVNAKDEDDTIVLRVCNWEEYIDLGDWDDDELIDLESGSEIIGESSMVDDFCEWYYETYGIKVEVEYSCFGTNEDLYNMLTLGDEYDLVCPSDYMIMKLMAEDRLQAFSDDFFDTDNEYNYYVNGVSPYIADVFLENQINGESWSKYAAGYMWGVTGILYNPEEISEEEASTWSILGNTDYERQVTIKDNVRDSYFAALGIYYADELLDEKFLSSESYHEQLTEMMNDVDDETISAVQDILQDIKDNVYSFETDSGKADMVSGKVLANYQWSGDAVYAMDQAEEDDLYLNFAVPTESTNLWFDGWVMLKDGIDGNAAKQHAAESFVNFLSRPDNAVRNMYYIGYTSVISGGDDDTVFEYVDWCYGAEDEEDAEQDYDADDEQEAVVDKLNDDSEFAEYALGYFFSGDSDDPDYILTVSAEQVNRQLYAQYPDEDTINRSAIMQYFDDDTNQKINQMWINVRCYNLKDVPVFVWVLVILIILAIAFAVIFYRKSD